MQTHRHVIYTMRQHVIILNTQIVLEYMTLVRILIHTNLVNDFTMLSTIPPHAYTNTLEYGNYSVAHIILEYTHALKILQY